MVIGNSTSAGNYYICTNCGMWVSSDSVHYCTDPTDRTTDRTQEIIDLLKQIISRLDGNWSEQKAVSLMNKGARDGRK
uniref:Uncharacterized protein n=1 Tax=viral metagenome TaxID=1070528 RepID=A0A6H1ZV37_9ZZZZ